MVEVLQELIKVVDTASVIQHEIDKLEKDLDIVSENSIHYITLDYRNVINLNDDLLKEIRGNIVEIVADYIEEKRKELEELLNPYKLIVKCDNYIDTDNLIPQCVEKIKKEHLNGIYGRK